MEILVLPTLLSALSLCARMESMLLIAEHWQGCCGLSETSRSVVNCGCDILIPENTVEIVRADGKEGTIPSVGMLAEARCYKGNDARVQEYLRIRRCLESPGEECRRICALSMTYGLWQDGQSVKKLTNLPITRKRGLPSNGDDANCEYRIRSVRGSAENFRSLLAPSVVKTFRIAFKDLISISWRILDDSSQVMKSGFHASALYIYLEESYSIICCALSC